jgi:hypothetical protein
MENAEEGPAPGRAMKSVVGEMLAARGELCITEDDAAAACGGWEVEPDDGEGFPGIPSTELLGLGRDEGPRAWEAILCCTADGASTWAASRCELRAKEGVAQTG